MGGGSRSREQSRGRQLADQERKRISSLLTGFRTDVGDRLGGVEDRWSDLRGYSSPEIPGLYADKQKAWDFAEQPLSQRVTDSLYGGGLYKKAVEGEHGLYDDPTYEGMISEAGDVTRSFGQSMQDQIARRARTQGDFAPVATGAGIREAAREFGGEASRQSNAARLGLERDIAGQRFEGAGGLQRGGQAEEGLIQSRWGTGAGVASNLWGNINQARGIEQGTRMGAQQGMSAETEGLMNIMMQTFGLDAATAAQMLGIRTGNMPDQSFWQQALLQAIQGGAQGAGAAAGAGAGAGAAAA